MFSPELIREEKRNLRVSGMWTAIIMAILLLLTLIFTAYRNRVPPPGKKYEVMGAIDFGDMREGSKQVNTRERSVPDPVEKPTQPAKPTPAPKPAEAAPTPPPQITTSKPTPVSQPDPPKVKKPDPIPTPPKTVTPKETKTETTNNTATNSQESKPEEKPVLTLDDSPSGANQGNQTTGTGNQGTPNTQVLDKNGLYSFGTGIGGSRGRGIVSLTDPVYNVQEEATIKFRFEILPDGTVGRIERPISDKPGLVRAGMAAIRSWRFTADANASSLWTDVTIRFKLR